MISVPILEGTYNVVKLGKRGKSITIPESYCKANGINPRDSFHIYVQGECLILQPVKKKGAK